MSLKPLSNTYPVLLLVHLEYTNTYLCNRISEFCTAKWIVYTHPCVLVTQIYSLGFNCKAVFMPSRQTLWSHLHQLFTVYTLIEDLLHYYTCRYGLPVPGHHFPGYYKGSLTFSDIKMGWGRACDANENCNYDTEQKMSVMTIINVLQILQP